MSYRRQELRFEASRSAGEVSALQLTPPTARALFVLAHGAGAGMRHPFMESVAVALADRGVATFRYQFAYTERGSRRPDPQPLLLACVRSAVDAARDCAPDLPLVAGGKSMGGRMTSLAAAAQPLHDVRGIAFLGFPLHPAGRPGTDRARHLADTRVPLLFVQGTRDTLAGLDLLAPIVDTLGSRARIHVIEDADHGFAVRRRVTGRSSTSVIDEIAAVVAEWCADVC